MRFFGLVFETIKGLISVPNKFLVLTLLFEAFIWPIVEVRLGTYTFLSFLRLVVVFVLISVIFRLGGNLGLNGLKLGLKDTLGDMLGEIEGEILGDTLGDMLGEIEGEILGDIEDLLGLIVGDTLEGIIFLALPLGEVLGINEGIWLEGDMLGEIGTA